MTQASRTRLKASAAALLLLPLSSSCVTVNAPDKPIEINLNVRIEQEVLVRLQRDVEQIIRESPETFPQTPRTPGTRQ